MREIQTKIRRDNIENDNRKNELQSKAQSGLKTAAKSTESEIACQHTSNDRDELQNKAQGGLKTAANSNEKEQENTQKKEEILSDEYEAFHIIAPDVSEIAHQPASESDDREIQGQIVHNSINSAVDHDIIHNKQDSDSIQSRQDNDNIQSSHSKETSPSAVPAYLRKEKAIKEFEKNYEQLNELLHSNDGIDYIASLKHSESLSSISVQAGVSRQVQRTLAEDIKNAQKATEEYYSAIAKTENELSSLLHNNVNTYTREIFDKFSASDVEKHTEKIQNLVKNISAAKENANRAVGKLNATLNNVGREIHNKAKVAAVKNAARKTVKTAVKAAGSTINIAGKLQGISSNADISDDLAKQGKETSAAAINKGIDLSKKAAKKANDSIKTAEQTKKVNNRALQKVQKRYIKTAHKRLVKNSATTAKNAVKTAKKTAKSAKTASQAAAKTAKTTVEVSEKIISGIAKAVGSLMSSPAGPIILAVVGVIVVIVLIFNIVAGAIQAPISMISGIGSSLSWLFDFGDDEDHSGDDITDLYNAFEQKAFSAMDDARTYYKDQIGEISFGERDTIEFNEALYYPASSADEIIQNYFDNLDYGDYVYLLEICYIKKLRDERIAQGLSETDIPEVTITKNDIFSFLIEYCYEFEITILEGQSCPTADCKEKDDITWCYSDEDCPDVVEEGDTCPGHISTETYCDNSHIKAVITIKPIPNDVIENVLLVLTEDEKNMLETGIDLLNNELNP